MKVLNNVLWVLVWVFMASACYEDKGNYDYRDLDEIIIDTAGAGIRTDYSVALQETLAIPLKVYCNGKLVNGSEKDFPELEFKWVAIQQETTTPILSCDTLSTEIELNVAVSLPTINWTLIFSVHNRQTETDDFMKFNLKVHAGLSEGWMVLYERNGKTDVGLIANDLVSPDVTQEKITLDVYSSLNGEAMNGKPVRVVYSMSTKPEVVYLVSDQEIMGVDPVSFTSLYTFDNLFYEVPAQRNITCFTVSSGRREFMVNDNKGYGLNASSMGSNRNTLKFGVPCKDESGELALWCAQMATAGYMGVVYNQSTQKFRCLKNNGSALSDFSVQGKEAAFDCNQVGLELVASDFGRNNYEHILMKDASGHHYLLVADFCGIFTQNAIGKAKYDLGGCEGLDKKVVSVTAGYKGEIFYYASGNTLYLLDYKSVPAKATPVWTAPAGTEITCVRLQKYLYGASGNKPVNDCEVIYIATADIAGEGVVYQLRVDPSSGVVDKSSEKSYDGFGRVMDMGWKKQ